MIAIIINIIIDIWKFMRNVTHIYFPLATDILKGMKSLTCFSDALIKGFFFSNNCVSKINYQT